MIRTTDGSGQYKRIPSVGDLHPTATGFQREVATYVATGGETSINLALLSPALSYMPGRHQLSIKRSSGGALMVGLDFTETSSTTVGLSDPLIAGEVIEITKEFTVTGVMAVEPRPDCYTATATAAQTLVTADFSWPYNLNAGKAIGGVKVFVQGFLWKRGVEYTEVNLGTTNTNQILVADGFVGGEDIVILPAYQAIDQTAGASTLANQSLASLQSMMSAGSQGFVDQSTDMIVVPNTQIVGRARIPNLANDLRASLGIERVMTQQIVQLQNEFGPDGQPVFSVVNDDRGLIRFVGGWFQYNEVYGARVYAGTAGYIEVVFYGTGLNILSAANTGVDAVLVSYDGGSETSVNLNLANQSSILGGRGYAQNCVVPVITALPLGVHTVKLRWAADAGTSYQGFEILNANASGLININPGVGYINGQKYVNSAADSVAYNTGVTGVRGGRIVRYLNSDGTVGQAFTAVDAAAAYLTSANHVNEEPVRPYNWREFGCGRADDFSLLSTARAAAFTLDDGTTTLVGDNVIAQSELLQHGGNSNYITFTFVGTGLDIVRQDNATGTASYTFSVDGGSATALNTNGSTARRVEKIASGLAYGTHTVKITRVTSSTYALGIAQFIVYQPKKPTIPTTALELCDYNVMGTYSTSTSSAKATPPLGTLRKINTREYVYTGTFVGATLSASSAGGFAINSVVATSSVSYTFFGTGVELLLGLAGSVAANSTVYIDSGNNLSSFTTSLIQSSTGLSWSAPTGALTGTSAASNDIRLCVSGLSLGVHTLKIVQNTTTDTFYFEGIDIITPIHAVKSNLYADLQNTLPVGSCSLTDSRKTSMIKEILPAQKATARAVGISNANTSSTSMVPIPGMSLTVKTNGGPLFILGNIALYGSGAGYNYAIQIYVDGVAVGIAPTDSGSTLTTMSVATITPVSAGVHKVDLYWSILSGATAVNTFVNRSLTVMEL